MSGTVVPRSGLDAEGDQAGADFRLGERTGAWSARRYSGRFGCGLTLDFLARYVIGYAASRTGVRISGGTSAGR